MSDQPPQRPEGRLIAAAAKRARPTVAELAREVGISAGRWYQIVRGYQTVSSDVYAPVRAPAETLARMAKAVGVTADELEEAGRADAAEELRALQPRPRTTADEVRDSALAPETIEALLGIEENLRRWKAMRDERRIRRARKIMDLVEDDQDTA